MYRIIALAFCLILFSSPAYATSWEWLWGVSQSEIGAITDGSTVLEFYPYCYNDVDDMPDGSTTEPSGGRLCLPQGGTETLSIGGGNQPDDLQWGVSVLGWGNGTEGGGAHGSNNLAGTWLTGDGSAGSAAISTAYTNFFSLEGFSIFGNECAEATPGTCSGGDLQLTKGIDFDLNSHMGELNRLSIKDLSGTGIEVSGSGQIDHLLISNTDIRNVDKCYSQDYGQQVGNLLLNIECANFATSGIDMLLGAMGTIGAFINPGAGAGAVIGLDRASTPGAAERWYHIAPVFEWDQLAGAGTMLRDQSTYGNRASMVLSGRVQAQPPAGTDDKAFDTFNINTGGAYVVGANSFFMGGAGTGHHVFTYNAVAGGKFYPIHIGNTYVSNDDSLAHTDTMNGYSAAEFDVGDADTTLMRIEEGVIEWRDNDACVGIAFDGTDLYYDKDCDKTLDTDETTLDTRSVYNAWYTAGAPNFNATSNGNFCLITASTAPTPPQPYDCDAATEKMKTSYPFTNYAHVDRCVVGITESWAGWDAAGDLLELQFQSINYSSNAVADVGAPFYVAQVGTGCGGYGANCAVSNAPNSYEWVVNGTSALAAGGLMIQVDANSTDVNSDADIRITVNCTYR